MDGLSQAVALYIQEHGEIDKDTYDHLVAIYTEGGAVGLSDLTAKITSTTKLKAALSSAIDTLSAVSSSDKSASKALSELQNAFKTASKNLEALTKQKETLTAKVR